MCENSQSIGWWGMKNIAVFVSGSGTNLENIAKKIENGELKNCRIALVVCDNPNAGALGRADNHKLKKVLIERNHFSNKTEFETKILSELDKNKIDFVVLAGYMKILGKAILEKFKWKIINIHPALLPNFPGAHAIKDAWEAKAKKHGVTVHFVDDGIDTGPIIYQKEVKIPASVKTIAPFEEEFHKIEYDLYPKAIQMLVSDKLTVVQNKVFLDGKPLTALVQ